MGKEREIMESKEFGVPREEVGVGEARLSNSKGVQYGA
jgi:hypothetical protein